LGESLSFEIFGSIIEKFTNFTVKIVCSEKVFIQRTHDTPTYSSNATHITNQQFPNKANVCIFKKIAKMSEKTTRGIFV